jgi:hypothetical protein
MKKNNFSAIIILLTFSLLLLAKSIFSADCYLDGYAWSENTGWIRFQSSGGSSDDAMHYWPLDEGSATTAYDAVSNNDATSTSGSIIWTSTSKLGGSAVQFDGTYYLGAGPESLSSAFSMEAWIYPATTSGGIIGLGYYQPTWGYSFDIQDGWLRLNYQVSNGSCNTSTTCPWASINDSSSLITGPSDYNKWYHVAVTYDLQNVKFYVNGNLRSVYPTTTVPYSASVNTIKMGNVGWKSFKGVIDEPRVYSRALSQSEIQAHANLDYNTSGSSYGVTVASTTGELSGYAWSENIGWISFDSEALTGCPDGNCQAILSRSTNEASGWARVCSVFVDSCDCGETCTTLKSNTERGGWDGFVKLSGEVTGDASLALAEHFNEGTGLLVSDDSGNGNSGIVSYATSGAPFGYWNFDEGSGSVVKDYISSNNGTLMNSVSPTWVTGHKGLGSALQLDGVDDFVNLGNSSNYNLASTSHTIEVWFKSNGLNASGTGGWILGRFTGGTPGAGYVMYLYDCDTIGIEERTDGANSFGFFNSIGNVCNDGLWHNIAYTVDIDNKIGYLYFDGSLLSSDTYTGGLINQNAILTFGNPGGTNGLNGAISDARIYKYVRSTAQIQKDYADSYWAASKSGLDKAFSFDGTGDYASVKGSSSLNISSAITIEAWINRSSLGASADILCNNWQTSYKGYEFGFTSSNLLKFRINPTSGTFSYVYSADPGITTGTWYHVVVVYDGTYVYFYKNGILLGSAQAAGGQLYPSTDAVRIGSYFDPAYSRFNGLIDEVRVYSRALSQSEIAAHAASNYSFGEFSYGVTLNTSPDPDELEGWAWGNDVMGWVSFNCSNQSVCGTSNYKVTEVCGADNAPGVGSLSVDSANSSDYCPPYFGYPGFPPVRVRWQFQDVGDSQSAFQIQVDDNSGFSSPTTTAKISDTCIGNCGEYVFQNIGERLSWGTTYYWRIVVWDEGGASSSWTTGPNIQTISHAYPNSDFDIAPLRPALNQLVTFTDQTACYPSGSKCSAAASASYFWDFGNGSTSNYEGSTSTKYDTTGQKSVSLTITDSSLSPAAVCTRTNTLTVGLSLPQWEEVQPITLLKELLADIPGFIGL